LRAGDFRSSPVGHPFAGGTGEPWEFASCWPAPEALIVNWEAFVLHLDDMAATDTGKR
jgi:hypothetical protein